MPVFFSGNLRFLRLIVHFYFLFWKRKRQKYSRGLLSINLWKARAQTAKKKGNAKSITRATVHLSIQFTWDIKLSVNAWWRNRATGFFCSAGRQMESFRCQSRRACIPSFICKMFPFKIKNERIYEFVCSFVDEFTIFNRKSSEVEYKFLQGWMKQS